MNNIKFRAIIPVTDTYRQPRKPVSFIRLDLTLHDIIFRSNFPLFYNSKGETVFSRYVFNRWIDQGNSPQRFAQISDKNRKEIYEGDYIKLDKNILDLWDSHLGVKEITVVTHMNFGFYPFMYGCPMSSDIEVLGNTTENPELANLLMEQS